MDITQRRVTLVLERMLKMVEESEDDAAMISSMLDHGLDNILASDGFGTEGQCDPRGDFRDGGWSMDCVQGIDPLEED